MKLATDAKRNEERRDLPKVLRISIVGRPNVGKSTLFNRLVGEDRSITHDMPGTTRDAIDTMVETDDGPVVFVDTAGMRRKSKVDDSAEYYSFVRALRAVDYWPDSPFVVVDASEGGTCQGPADLPGANLTPRAPGRRRAQQVGTRLDADARENIESRCRESRISSGMHRC